eukprot:Protomagalhaensia_sp_Gyna_25__2239@NODE_221_length_4318_cov_20_071746_g172_i0_p1_GENE_NODE_221_length_4318_cov_20_071746_g172_i0NODE_221_length_4318_cov_20_071746_g172_i0_p1_ORF_typecomplete_len984_score271_99LZ3wCH/PF18517_1/0_15DUF1192/PF06698_11/8_6e02DUF1192/PF06698_11/2_2e02DUF1192/PF06698_11/4_3_NODE_221_length_4318_cov_20_071746_g172_i013464297
MFDVVAPSRRRRRRRKLSEEEGAATVVVVDNDESVEATNGSVEILPPSNGGASLKAKRKGRVVRPPTEMAGNEKSRSGNAEKKRVENQDCENSKGSNMGTAIEEDSTSLPLESKRKRMLRVPSKESSPCASPRPKRRRHTSACSPPKLRKRKKKVGVFFVADEQGSKEDPFDAWNDTADNILEQDIPSLEEEEGDDTQGHHNAWHALLSTKTQGRRKPPKGKEGRRKEAKSKTDEQINTDKQVKDRVEAPINTPSPLRKKNNTANLFSSEIDSGHSCNGGLTSDEDDSDNSEGFEEFHEHSGFEDEEEIMDKARQYREQLNLKIDQFHSQRIEIEAEVRRTRHHLEKQLLARMLFFISGRLPLWSQTGENEEAPSSSSSSVLVELPLVLHYGLNLSVGDLVQRVWPLEREQRRFNESPISSLEAQQRAAALKAEIAKRCEAARKWAVSNGLAFLSPIGGSSKFRLNTTEVKSRILNKFEEETKEFYTLCQVNQEEAQETLRLSRWIDPVSVVVGFQSGSINQESSIQKDKKNRPDDDGHDDDGDDGSGSMDRDGIHQSQGIESDSNGDSEVIESENHKGTLSEQEEESSSSVEDSESSSWVSNAPSNHSEIIHESNDGSLETNHALTPVDQGVSSPIKENHAHRRSRASIVEPDKSPTNTLTSCFRKEQPAIETVEESSQNQRTEEAEVAEEAEIVVEEEKLVTEHTSEKGLNEQGSPHSTPGWDDPPSSALPSLTKKKSKKSTGRGIAFVEEGVEMSGDEADHFEEEEEIDSAEEEAGLKALEKEGFIVSSTDQGEPPCDMGRVAQLFQAQMDMTDEKKFKELFTLAGRRKARRRNSGEEGTLDEGEEEDSSEDEREILRKGRNLTKDSEYVYVHSSDEDQSSNINEEVEPEDEDSIDGDDGDELDASNSRRHHIDDPIRPQKHQRSLISTRAKYKVIHTANIKPQNHLRTIRSQVNQIDSINQPPTKLLDVDLLKAVLQNG